LANKLADEGFPEDEIEELLFNDPDADVYRPKRRRHHARRGRGRRTYDPAPKRSMWRRFRKSRSASAYPRKGRRGKRGILAKIGPWVMPGTAGLTFYTGYVARAKALGTNTETGKPHDVFSAIMYDIKNFDSNAAMARMQAKAAPILGATIGGMIVSKFAPGKLKLLGKVLTGIGVGQAAKVILDPPIVGSPQTDPAMVEQAPVQQYTPPTQTRNPYLNGGY